MILSIFCMQCGEYQTIGGVRRSMVMRSWDEVRPHVEDHHPTSRQIDLRIERTHGVQAS